MSSHSSASANDPRMKKTWFISDLHLDPSRPQIFKLLHEFLDDIQQQAEALYILGDLFEFWIGDDVTGSPLGEPYIPVIRHLHELSRSGVKIFFTQGNRDFLVRKDFIERIGATLLPDTIVIDLYGAPTLLLHGDTLCSDDKNYQRMRALFRIRLIQNLYLSLSLERRSRQANGVRKATHKRVQNKHHKILDVNQLTVENLMLENNVKQMIHGHTHRPAVHEFHLNGDCATRFVLGDWHDKASFIKASNDGLELVS